MFEPSAKALLGVKDEKKDEESVDMDAVLWSENPEKEYFRSMMEDQRGDRLAQGKSMEDSVLGEETLASLMKEGPAIHQRVNSKEKTNMMIGGDDHRMNIVGLDDDVSTMASLMKEGPAIHNRSSSKEKTNMMIGGDDYRMNIVGLEDDVSTIANESVDRRALSRPNSYDSKAGVSWQRDFVEYVTTTPEKKKENPNDDGDDDEATVPETPPSKSKDSQSKSNSSNESDNDTAESSFDQGESYGRLSPRTKKIFLGAVCMGAILLIAVIVCAVALAQLRSDDDSSSEQHFVESANDVAASYPTDFTMTSPPISFPSPTNEPAPTTSVESTPQPVGQQPTEPPVMEPTVSPTDDPTAAPAFPTDSPTYPPGTRDDLLTILTDRVDSSTLTAIASGEPSPQYYSFEWLASDPNYYDYGPARLVQRFVLGVLGLSLSDGTPNAKKLLRARENSMISVSVLSDSWLTYTDECTWYSSREKDLGLPFCDDAGLITHLEVRNLNLFGTIPEELSLLSDTLTVLHLNGNKLEGTIPTALGLLRNLKRIQLTRNSLTGTIASELGSLNDLALLGLGRNDLEGTLPTELGLLGEMHVLDAASNKITGTIPLEYGELWNLERLTLQGNRLTGAIPDNFEDLWRLKSLELDYNNLEGTLPDRLCRDVDLEVFAVDCLRVDECTCCTDCGNPNAVVPCRTSIEVAEGEGCVVQGDTIQINFENCEPEEDDWIGIYPTWEDLDSEPVLWTWACGSQDCRGAVMYGTVQLSEEHKGEGKNGYWPLWRDDYIAVLVRRNSDSGSGAYAESESFEITRNNC